MTLLEAAKTAAKWMKEWLDDNLCECEGLAHGCGRTERMEELIEIQRAIRKAEEEGVK